MVDNQFLLLRMLAAAVTQSVMDSNAHPPLLPTFCTAVMMVFAMLHKLLIPAPLLIAVDLLLFLHPLLLLAPVPNSLFLLLLLLLSHHVLHLEEAALMENLLCWFVLPEKGRYAGACA